MFAHKLAVLTVATLPPRCVCEVARTSAQRRFVVVNSRISLVRFHSGTCPGMMKATGRAFSLSRLSARPNDQTHTRCAQAGDEFFAPCNRDTGLTTTKKRCYKPPAYVAQSVLHLEGQTIPHKRGKRNAKRAPPPCVNIATSDWYRRGLVTSVGQGW